MSSLINLIGRKFGKLVVIEYSGLNKYMKATWLCKCECGNEKHNINYNTLKSRIYGGLSIEEAISKPVRTLRK